MERKTEELLEDMARHISEPVPHDLGERIKVRIPPVLTQCQGAKGPVNIIVHLRISRLAAAAAIVITMMICGLIYRSHSQDTEGLYDDLKTLVTFLPNRGEPTEQVMAGFQNFSLSLQEKGKDVVFFGNVIDKPSADTLLMYWQMDNGDYRVVYGDFCVSQLNTTELIEAQSRMLLSLKD